MKFTVSMGGYGDAERHSDPELGLIDGAGEIGFTGTCFMARNWGPAEKQLTLRSLGSCIASGVEFLKSTVT